MALHEQEVQTAALLIAVTLLQHQVQHLTISWMSWHDVELLTLENAMWEDLQYTNVEFSAGDLQENHNGLQYLNAQLKLFDHLNSEMAVANQLGLDGNDGILQDNILDNEELLKLQGIEEMSGLFHC
jgi:hypothetical protein